MADVIAPEEELIPQIENDEFSYEVTNEELTEKDENVLSLEAKLAEQQAMIDKLKEQTIQSTAQTAATSQLDELAKVLKAQQSAVPVVDSVRIQDQQAEYLKLVEDVRANWHSDPTGNSLKLIEPLMNQMQANMNAKVGQVEMKTSKLMALNGPDKDLFGSYGDEIEEYVKTLPPSENAYQTALKQVKANHMDELVNNLVEQKLQEQIEKIQAGNTQGNSVPQGQFTLSTQPAVPAEKFNRQKIKINVREEQFLKDYALKHTINWNNPDRRNFLVSEYKAGRIR